MNISQMNAYGAYSTNTATSNNSSSSVNTTDFLRLLAAQMSNQDVMNPMQDTEFISQMAQFTTLQTTQNLYDNSSSQLKAILALSEICYAQYSATMVGKTVVVATVDSEGKYAEHQGVVDSVNFASENYTISVDGKNYELSSIMKVVTDKSTT